MHRWTSTGDLPSSVCTAGPQRPDRMPEDMPDRMPEDMPDRMPEDLPVTKCINVMVGITRFKVIFVFFSRFLPLFRESWLGPPSKESRNIFCFSKVFTKCGVLQGHESQAKLSKCLWECRKTSQNIILNHGKTALPGAAVFFLLLHIYIILTDETLRFGK